MSNFYYLIIILNSIIPNRVCVWSWTSVRQSLNGRMRSKTLYPEHSVLRSRIHRSALKSAAGIDNYEINIAREETIRWCDNFVVKLNLCPWASASMQSFHSLSSDFDVDTQKYKSGISGNRPTVIMKFLELPRDIGYYEAQQELACKVRDEATWMVTEEADIIMGGKKVTSYNPDIAITFIVVIPEEDNKISSSSEDKGRNEDWVYSDENFESFHDTVVYIEDEFLPSFYAPEAAVNALIKEGTIDEDERGQITLADLVAIAGFHPKWEFGTPSSHSNDFDLQAVSYEKKSPYPTVTVVHWSAIDKGANDVSDVTEHIASHNSKVLGNLGLETLQNKFQKDVKVR